MAATPYLISFTQTGTAVQGILTSTQQAEDLPFKIKRVFWIQDAPTGIVRGHHANRTTEEILIALAGTIHIKAETATGISEFTLSASETGLYIPALCWTELTFAERTVALCLASTDYDEQDYLRDYDNYKQLIGKL